MRIITAKFDGECRECGEAVERGIECYHDKPARSVFCKGCGDTMTDEALRQHRQDRLDRSADRLKDRAAKKRAKASELYGRDEFLLRDHAFLTQPGDFPLRRQVMRRQEKAHELSDEAEQLERRANHRKATVKGDAAARNEKRREAVRQWIEPGMKVDTCHMGIATVVKINKKTAKVRTWTGSTCNHDLMFMSKAEEGATA